jgi:hypothetical protein
MLLARNAKVAHIEEDMSGRVFAEGLNGSPAAKALRDWLDEHPDARIHFVVSTSEPGSHRLHMIIWYEE